MLVVVLVVLVLVLVVLVLVLVLVVVVVVVLVVLLLLLLRRVILTPNLKRSVNRRGRVRIRAATRKTAVRTMCL